MKRVKLAKKGKATSVSPEDVEQMSAIYNIRAMYSSGMYITPILQDKCTLVRLTFTEYNAALDKPVPVTAIICSIEDVQNMYNAMTQLLQNMRQMGKIA